MKLRTASCNESPDCKMQKYSEFHYIPTLNTENEVHLYPTVML